MQDKPAKALKLEVKLAFDRAGTEHRLGTAKVTICNVRVDISEIQFVEQVEGVGANLDAGSLTQYFRAGQTKGLGRSQIEVVVVRSDERISANPWNAGQR